MKAVYPGSFDPVTYGHLDVIRRASKLCDELVVAVLDNVGKNGLFSSAERETMLAEAIKDLPNVSVRQFHGLAAELCLREGADAMIRGVRNQNDFSDEFQLCQVNRMLNPQVETLLIVTDLKYSIVSSSGAKEIAAFGGDLSGFLPPFVERKLREKYREKSNEQN